MHRTVSLAVILAGTVAFTTFAQAPEPKPVAAGVILPGGKVQVMAKEAQNDGDVVTLRDGVSFHLADGTVVRADDAVLNYKTGEAELHGTVRMTIPPDARPLK